MYIQKKFILLILVMSFFVSVHSVYALSTNLIVCDGVTVPCDFNALVQLATNFINFLIVYSVPLAVISFIYAGVLYLTSQGNPGQINKAHGIFKTTAIGFVFVLSAWLIVSALTGSLLSSGFNPLTPGT